MVLLISLYIFVAFAVALTPEFIKVLDTAQSSWPEGSFMLNLIPSPIDFALFVLVILVISLLTYLVAQFSQ